MRAVAVRLLGRVVDDLAGSQRPDELKVLGVAHSGDVGSEIPGQLNRRGADGSRRAVDEDLLPFRRSARLRHASALRAPSQTAAASSKAHAGRLVRDQAALAHANKLRVCAEHPRVESEDLVTARELGDRRASCFDLSRQFAAEDPRLGRRRPANSRHMNGSAARRWQSVRLTVVAWILMRTSSSLGAGRSTSSSRRTSGGPYLS